MENKSWVRRFFNRVLQLWNIYQFLVWVVGTGMITFIVHAVSKTVRDAPFGWQILLYVCVGAFVLLVVLSLAHYLWPKVRKWFPSNKATREFGTKTEIVKNLTIIWLEQNLISDLELLKNGNALFFTDYSWDFSGVQQPEAFIKLDVKIVSNMIFNLSLKQIKDRFWIEKLQCNQLAELVTECSLSRRQIGVLTIKQRISDAMAKVIIKECGSPRGSVEINLWYCKVMAYPEIPGMKTEPVEIPIVSVVGKFEVKWTPT